MNADKATQELKVIRQLMERPVRYSTMSGLSGVLAGLVAIGGVAASLAVNAACQAKPPAAMHLNLLIWAGVFVAAFAEAIICTRLRERRQHMPSWSAVKRRILLTILPPFIAAVGLTAIIVWRCEPGLRPADWGLIPAIWMICYGLALWQVGQFSPVEVRLLGVAFLAAGLASAAWAQAQPYWSLGVAFGGFHLIYGLVVWIRHGG